MNTAGKLLELEALSENLLKRKCNSGLLRLKILYLAEVYHNLSVSMIIEKLGIKKSNFALMTSALADEGLIELKSTEIDRRCRTICLTQKGKDELEAYKKQIESLIGPTSMEVEHALDTIVNFLNKIV